MLYKKYEAKDCVGATDESTQIISEAILAEQLSRPELDELCESADEQRNRILYHQQRKAYSQ